MNRIHAALTTERIIEFKNMFLMIHVYNNLQDKEVKLNQAQDKNIKVKFGISIYYTKCTKQGMEGVAKEIW